MENTWLCMKIMVFHGFSWFSWLPLRLGLGGLARVWLGLGGLARVWLGLGGRSRAVLLGRDCSQVALPSF